MNIKSKSIIHLYFSLALGFLLIQCAKTKDVLPLEENTTQYYGFVLNEVLYDPPSGVPGGAANNDGVREPNDDEFVEFVNSSANALDISGYKIFDSTMLLANTPNHVFPDSTIVAPGQAVVVFGGGNPTGNFGGALVMVASNHVLNLNNSSDGMILKDNNDSILIFFDVTILSNNPNESYTKFPDLYGDFIQHNDANAGILFSPGTKVDGSSF